MPIPPYMWLKDDGGADIKGSVDVQDREGSIEIIGLSHGINLPVNSANGAITGTRQHSSMRIEKEVDSSTPYLYKAAATGQALKSAEIKFYHINDAGQEVCYYTVFMRRSPGALLMGTSSTVTPGTNALRRKIKVLL